MTRSLQGVRRITAAIPSKVISSAVSFGALSFATISFDLPSRSAEVSARPYGLAASSSGPIWGPRVAYADEVMNAAGTTDGPATSAESSEVLIITASRLPRPEEETGSSVTVVTGESIEQFGDQSVGDALSHVPGLEISQAGGEGKVTGVFLRGANSNQVLVLIDGVRVNSNLSDAYDFADLRADNIERIEVVRGPQSVLYGSEAIGGVINIITRRGSAPAYVNAETQVTSRGRTRNAAFGGGAAHGFDVSGGLSFQTADDLSAASESRGNREDDPYRNLSFNTRLGADLPEEGRADLFVRMTNADTELDGFEYPLGAIDDVNFDQHRDEIISSIQISQPVNSWLTPRVKLSATKDKVRGADSDTAFNDYTFESTTLHEEVQLDVGLSDWSSMTVGQAYERRGGELRGTLDDGFDVRALFVENRLSFGEQTFATLGLRDDHYSAFADRATYRVTLSQLVPQTGSRIHSSYGTGFRAPTFVDLFFPQAGNPNLTPEDSSGVDFGVEQQLLERALSADLTYFYNDFSDLIVLNSETFLPENIASARAQGLEASLHGAVPSDVQWQLSYTLTETEDNRTGGPLARRPRHRITGQLAYTPAEKCHFTAEYVLVRDRLDSDGSRMDDYNRADVGFLYDLTPSLQPYVRMENLWDEDYEEVTGYSTRGAEVIVGLDARL